MTDCPLSESRCSRAAEEPAAHIDLVLLRRRALHTRAQAALRQVVLDRAPSGMPGIGLCADSGRSRRGDRTPVIKNARDVSYALGGRLQRAAQDKVVILTPLQPEAKRA